MLPSGLAEVESCARGRALGGRLRLPSDRHRARGSPGRARRRAAAGPLLPGLDSANRYAVLYRVQEAKRPETRARRIAKYVAMLAAGEKLHP